MLASWVLFPLLSIVQFHVLGTVRHCVLHCASTIFTIALVSDSVTCIVIYYVCTTLLLQMVSSCGKLCSFERIIKGLAYYSSVGIDGIATS